MKKTIISGIILLSCLTAFAGKEKDSFEELYLQAEDYYYAGFKDKAKEILNKIISANPEHIGALKKLAEIYNSEGKYQEAAQNITKVVTLRPNLPGALDLAGLVYKNLGNAEKAKEYFKKACDLGVSASCKDLNSGVFQAGSKYAKPAMKNPFKEGSADYYYQQGKIYQSQAKYDDALVAFEQAVSVDPKHAKALEEAGYEWSMKGNYEKAIEYYKKAIDINKKNGNLWDRLGLAYNSMGNQEEAKKAFEQACKLGIQASCNDAQAMGSNVKLGGKGGTPDLAEIQKLIADGDLNKAEEQLKDLIENSPNHYLTYYAFAEYFYKLKDYDFAMLHLKKSMDIHPTYFQSWALLSKIYADTKKVKESADALKKACKLGYKSENCPK
ncbi:MAG: tetratricopeptide repeat protein [Deltaproteobacteria bacterium]|nr:tetratricopeptide repeat protein [Deltaproteobacteria bacterium]